MAAQPAASTAPKNVTEGNVFITFISEVIQVRNQLVQLRTFADEIRDFLAAHPEVETKLAAWQRARVPKTPATKKRKR